MSDPVPRNTVGWPHPHRPSAHPRRIWDIAMVCRKYKNKMKHKYIYRKAISRFQCLVRSLLSLSRFMAHNSFTNGNDGTCSVEPPYPKMIPKMGFRIGHVSAPFTGSAPWGVEAIPLEKAICMFSSAEGSESQDRVLSHGANPSITAQSLEEFKNSRLRATLLTSMAISSSGYRGII